MNIEEKIYKLSKTYISLNELESLLEYNSYKDEYDIISNLVNIGTLTPVIKKGNTNGCIPPLYLKYRINKPNEDNSEIISEIKHLESSFNISYYLENINKYREQRAVILPLSRFLKDNCDELINRISKNERAYQIWNYEKKLDETCTKSVLEINDLLEKLNFYNTPEPFFYYTPEKNRNTEAIVLIIENKDTWYSMREIMRTLGESFYICRKRIDGLLYGEGKKITRETALKEFHDTELKHKCNFLYFGDLDYEGIKIFQSLKEKNKSYNIELFIELYELMLDLYPYEKLGKMSKNQHKSDNTHEFLSLFNNKYSDRIDKILSNGKYIPQEALRKDILDKFITKTN